jgi:protein O-GlcNAc transferase
MNDRAVADALRGFRNGTVKRAIVELERLAALNPQSARVHNALGSVLAASGRSHDAVDAFRRALALSPSHPEAGCNLGQALLEQGKLQLALEAFERAIASGQAPAQAHVGMGRVWLYLGRHDQAAACFERARLHPGAHAGIQSQCCYSALLHPEYDARTVVAIHRHCAVEAALDSTTTSNPEHDDGRPVIGYVSADFREHSVASFLEGVLRTHDRSKFRIHLYSDVQREDSTTERLKALVDHYLPVARRTHRQLVQEIRQHSVRVLVDLAGHMSPNRLPVFMARPAPVQLTYLGYPGTTGLPCFDARLSDKWADPADDPALAGTEPLMRIEGGYFGYTPPADAPELERKKPGASVVFGCMSDALKLNDDVLRTWSEILRALPDSRLVLKNRALAWDDVRTRVQRVLSGAGVALSRVELLASTPGRREHLACYSEIDLALDAFPYSGATTTCEALYMGVPVLTLAGDHHRHNLSTSILSAAGLERFVTKTRSAYVRLALALVRDPGALAEHRLSLRDRLRASTLCDGKRIARTIEAFA